MDVRIIKTEAEYESALEAIESLMEAEPGSLEEERLELLSLLVEKYEDERYPIAMPDPVEAIKFRMEQEGLSRKDMIQYLGSQSKVSEVLNYKRPLSLSMIRALNEGLDIPAEVLLQPVAQDDHVIDPDEQIDELTADIYFNCKILTEEIKKTALQNWLKSSVGGLRR